MFSIEELEDHIKKLEDIKEKLDSLIGDIVENPFDLNKIAYSVRVTIIPYIPPASGLIEMELKRFQYSLDKNESYRFLNKASNTTSFAISAKEEQKRLLESAQNYDVPETRPEQENSEQ